MCCPSPSGLVICCPLVHHVCLYLQGRGAAPGWGRDGKQSPLDQPPWHSPHHNANKQGNAKEQTPSSDQEGIGKCHRMGAGFHDRP